MEKEATGANNQVSEVADEEYDLMSLRQTAAYAFQAQVQKQEVREAVDNLCRILRRIVVLHILSEIFSYILACIIIPLHTSPAST
jgi:tRNA U34 5-carboxymethylaminomethyl modifying GTPase MnmE/TrmE